MTQEWKRNGCDPLGSFPPLLRPQPSNMYTNTRVFLISQLQRTGLGIFLKTPSRCLSVTLVTAVQGSGKGSLCLPRSPGTCLLPSVPPLAWVYTVVWVHHAPRVTEHRKDSGPSPGIAWEGLAGPPSGTPAHFPEGRQPVGSGFLHPLNRSHSGWLKASLSCTAHCRLPDGPGLGDRGAQPPLVPQTSQNPLAQHPVW